MKFGVTYSRRATRFCKQSPKVLLRRLSRRIKELQKNPVPQDSKIVQGTKEMLFRVGNYRILYEVDSRIGIVNMDKRSRVF
jgi:mRNA-degrading endonuclease RelE of RelBE toxin-antitoxin system